MSEEKKGFVDDPDCPTLLGKGFGPECYRILFEEWKQISSKTDFESTHLEGVQLLLSRMSCIESSEVHEAVLSGTVASTYQLLLQRFGEGGNTKLCFEHQTCVPLHTKAACSVDIAVTNSFDVGHMGKPMFHAIIEVEWDYFENRFPEIQAAACAGMLYEAESLRHPWIPIFVLSKTHFRFGVAFQLCHERWVYSEIHEFRNRGPFMPTNPADVLMLCRFYLFLVKSAAYHQSFVGTADQCLLVDQTGSKILEGDVAVIADRNMRGNILGGSQKILKFYEGRRSADNAIANQVKIESALAVETHAELILGCGDGMCAVRNPYINNVSRITKNHLKKLTMIVSTLYSKGLLDGDRRLQNIRFGLADTVSLIDFDWAGSFHEVKFPMNVFKPSFGKTAASWINPGRKICSHFDWLCLADILLMASPTAENLARDAAALNESAVLMEIDSFTSQELERISRELELETPKVLNLGRLCL